MRYLITLTFTLVLLAPSASSIPTEMREASSVGDTRSNPSLAEIDREVSQYGINERYERSVIYADVVSSGKDPEDNYDGQFVVVRYGLPSDETEFGTGVEVWINRAVGRRMVIPKAILRKAAMAASEDGYDLTRYVRAAERVGDRFYITYAPRPAGPGFAALDGEVTITFDAKTGKRLRIK